MIDVHLIGYTADLRHLVLDLDGGADGRYRLVVDADLFATVDQLRDERRKVGLPVGDPEEFLTAEELAALRADEDDDREEEPGTADDGPSEGMWERDDALFAARDEALAAAADEDIGEDPEQDPEDDHEEAVDEAVEGDDVAPPVTVARVSDRVRLVEPSPFRPEGRRRPAPQPRAAPQPDGHAEPRREPEPEREPEPPRPAPEPTPAPRAPTEEDPEAAVAAVEPKLGPAQIQALLRAGRSPRVVAREAGTDVAWIERWLPPILAERTRILDRAQSKRLERPRLGRSRDPLGQAVARNLADKGVPEDALTWEAARRKDGRWKVSVRFTQRDRPRTATWTYDPNDDELTPASDLAHELGFSRAPKTDAPEKAATGRPAGGRTSGRRPR